MKTRNLLSLADVLPPQCRAFKLLDVLLMRSLHSLLGCPPTAQQLVLWQGG